MPFSTGYDMGDDYKFDDGLGKLYTIIAGVWTIILVCGMSMLLRHRNLPFIRIRNIPLAISAVANLHVYWVLCMIAYGLNGHWPCKAEFWIMNIYLPLGIALFHATNSQLLFTAGDQQKFTSSDFVSLDREKAELQLTGWRAHLNKIKARKGIKHAMHGIGLAILTQFIIAIVIFYLSRRFQPKSGIIGENISGFDIKESRKLCRHGFEWLPSIFWQFFWAWIYAPYMLWKVRNIRDVNGWRIQTICCCIVGLPASPLWLLALYLPQMKNVSRYFIPPLWFSPSIFLMELFMVFTPCWQILKNRRLKKETLEIIEEWERQKLGSSFESDSTRVGTGSSMSQRPSVSSLASSRKAQSHLYTMAALDKALQTNPMPLLLFAALKDFSGENISFLNAVKDWKDSWVSTQTRSSLPPSAVNFRIDKGFRSRLFKKGVEIYASFVSLRYSDYPINISSAHLKELETIFESFAAIMTCNRSRANAATPFDDWDSTKSYDTEMHSRNHALPGKSTMVEDHTIAPVHAELCNRDVEVVEGYKLKNLDEALPGSMPIPPGFGPDVFDDAIDSIKYTVLTNTWPKFVNAGYAATNEQISALERFQERVTECRTGFARLLSF